MDKNKLWIPFTLILLVALTLVYFLRAHPELLRNFTRHK
jgi:hypothetical protein